MAVTILVWESYARGAGALQGSDRAVLIFYPSTSICLIRRLLTFHLEILLKSKLSRLTKIHAEVRHLQHSVIEFADFSCTEITRAALVQNPALQGLELVL